MQREYGRRFAARLRERFGGEDATWVRAHDGAWEAYVNAVEGTDWEARPWAETVDAMDARFIVDILRDAGVAWRPDDPGAFSRSLESEIMATVDARFPDARTAVDRLRSAGHRVYVATQASESNARGSLRGAHLLDHLDDVFTGTSQNAPKTRGVYWSQILERLSIQGRDCVVVDDRADYLRAAADAGFSALLLDREGVYEGVAVPAWVRAVLRNLAGAPQAVDLVARGGLR